MTLTEKFANDQRVKAKAQAYDAMQNEAVLTNAQKQGYGMGANDMFNRMLSEYKAMQAPIQSQPVYEQPDGLAAMGMYNS